MNNVLVQLISYSPTTSIVRYKSHNYIVLSSWLISFIDPFYWIDKDYLMI